MISNTATLRRVDGNINIPVHSMSLSLDVDSWTWGFTAKIPEANHASIEPSYAGVPVLVEASINGVLYEFLIEGVSRSREFGKATLSLSGRGFSAVLDAPYAPVLQFNNSAPRTAQQLMDDILSPLGGPPFWTVTSALTDWLVPSGLFSHQGTYMSGVKAIAEAVGGYVQPANTGYGLYIKHRYPVVPWSWNVTVPDYTLPPDVTVKEDTTWEERARYNRVYVAGQQAGGVLGNVLITGTAGDVLAPMVTDPLITHADAARQRGMAILGATGRATKVSLSLPVMPETGIIKPGSFIQYMDGLTTRIGLSRSVQVAIDRPQIRQTIGVETYVS